MFNRLYIRIARSFGARPSWMAIGFYCRRCAAIRIDGLATVDVPANQCNQCGHIWLPRGDEPPALCPKCKSRRWDRAPRAVKTAALLAEKGVGE